MSVHTLDPITVVDTLLKAAKDASAIIENLDEKCTSMRGSYNGVLPDGTPVDDMITELREAKAELANLRRLMQSIGIEARRPYKSQAWQALQAIRGLIANGGL
jgi:hypothetical protein